MSRADGLAGTATAAAARRVRVWVPLIVAGHFLIDMYLNFLPPLLPLLAAKLGLSLALCGSAIAIVSFCSSFLQPAFGYAIDRRGHAVLLLPTLVWTGALAASLGFVHTYAAIVAVAALSGLGSALYHPLGVVVINAVSRQDRDRSMGAYSAVGNLGYALAPLLVVPVAEMLGFPHLGWFVLPMVVVTALFVAFGLWRAPLRAAHPVPIPREAVLDPRAAASARGTGLWYALSRWRFYELFILNLAVGVRSWVYYAWIVFVPLYYTSRGYSAVRSTQLMTAILVAGTVGGLIGGWASGRWGRRRVTLWTTLLGVPLFWAALPHQGALSILLLLAGSAILYLAIPATIVMAQDMAPGHKGMAAGTMTGLCWGLGGVGAALTGLLADHVGIVWALRYTTLTLPAAAALLLFVRPDAPTRALRRGRTEPSGGAGAPSAGAGLGRSEREL